MSDNNKTLAIFAIGPIWIFFLLFLLELCSFALIGIPTFSLAIVALISTAFLPLVFFGDRKVSSAFLSAFGSIALIAVCFATASLIYDTSYDGQTYHQLAVSFLRYGWNFLTPDLQSISRFKPEYQLPLLHYPKFPWLVESIIYGITQNIEGAKALNLVFIVCSLLLTFVAARQMQFSGLNSLLIASALSLNPVSVCQIWTFYIDGLLASSILFFLSALCIYYSQKKAIWAHLAGLALIILLHIKFTSLVVLGSILIILLPSAYRKVFGSKQLLKILLGYLVFGGVVVGWHPYVTNILSTGNPIYPIAGYSPIGKTPSPSDWPIFSLVQGQQPEVLKDLPGPIKTLLSIFSRPSDPLSPNSEYNFFWQTKLNDISRFVVPDLRLGGFGQLFPGALITSILLLFCLKKDEPKGVFLPVCAAIILSSLLNPESWWSRYSPQLWMLPILFAVSLKFQSIYRTICSALILNSIAILIVNTNSAYLNSKALNLTLLELSSYTNSNLQGSTENFYANELRLNKLNIRLSVPIDCPNKVYLAGSPSFICKPN